MASEPPMPTKNALGCIGLALGVPGAYLFLAAWGWDGHDSGPYVVGAAGMVVGLAFLIAARRSS